MSTQEAATGQLKGFIAVLRTGSISNHQLRVLPCIPESTMTSSIRADIGNTLAATTRVAYSDRLAWRMNA